MKETPQIYYSPDDTFGSGDNKAQVLINAIKFGSPADIIKIKEFSGCPLEIWSTPEVLSALEGRLISDLKIGWSHSAVSIKNNFNLPPEILESKKVLDVAKEGLVSCLKQVNINNAVVIKDNFNLPLETLESKEVLDAAKEGLVLCLRRGEIDYAIKIKNNFNLPPEILESKEILNVIKEALVFCLKNWKIDYVVVIKDKFNLPQVWVDAVVKEMLAESLKTGQIDVATFIKNNLSLPQEMLSAAIKEALILALKNGHIDYIAVINDNFGLSSDILESKEVLDAAKKALIKRLKNGQIDGAIKIKDNLNLPLEILESEEVVVAIEKALVESLEMGQIDDAIKIKDNFNLPPDLFNAVVKKGLVGSLKMGRAEDAVKIKDNFNLPLETLESKEVLDVAKEGLVLCLKKELIESAIKIKDNFNLPPEILESKEVLEAAKEGLVLCLKVKITNLLSVALLIKDNFNLPLEILESKEVLDAAKKALIKRLKNGHIDDAVAIKDKFNLPPEILESKEMLDAVKEGLVLNLKRGHINGAVKIKDNFNLPLDMLEASLKEGLIEGLNTWRIDVVVSIKDRFNLSDEVLHSQEVTDAVKEKMIMMFNDCLFYRVLEVKEKLKISKDDWEYIVGQSVFKEKEDLLGKILLKKDLDESEAESLLEIYKLSQNFNKEIYDWMVLGGKQFSLRNIFKYIKYDFGNAHDKLQFIGKISRVAEESGLSFQEFYSNIMHQVSMDGSSYRDGNSSHQYFNAIINAFSFDKIELAIKKAKKYQDIDKMQELVNGLNDKNSVFNSWKNFKKFYEITELLNKAELLEKLEKIKKTDPRQYKYFETLLFHPNINTQAVIDLFENPESFFETGDIHSEKLHEEKKPSNYFDIPNLDLDAGGLRDAIIGGHLDKIQTFKPFEVIFEIPKGENNEMIVTKDLISSALGSRRKNIKGQAINPEKLFSELNAFLKQRETNIVKFLEDEGEIAGEIFDDVSKIVFNKEYGMKKTIQESVVFRAKINLKSDPDGVVAGDDTACCMPFGSGKNNLYTANPMCALFTVQRSVGDNKWKTVAQSVLTKNVDIKKEIPKILSEVQGSGKKLENILPEDILVNSKKYITCDNIEVSSNFRSKENEDMLIKIYAKFFYEYLKNIENEGFDKNRVVVGLGYLDISDTSGQSLVENTFLPVTPVAYSDNTYGKAMVISIKDQEEIKIKGDVVKIDVEESQTLRPKSLIKKIEPLTYEDSLQTGYLESKVYADNQNLITNLHNMENGLIAKDINNSLKNRVNLSLKYVDTDGKMLGYILAYEGSYNGEPVIYISDLAVNRGELVAAGKLIFAFMDLYQKNYIDKGNTIDMLAEARESTSYPLIKKGIGNMSKKLGREITIEELSSRKVGNDMMHKMKIIIEKDKEVNVEEEIPNPQ